MAWKAKEDSAFQHLAESADRYAGLLTSRMADTDDHHQPEDSIFILSGHPNEKAGTACLIRRNRNRLERHLTYARDDLASSLEMIEGLDIDREAIGRVEKYLDQLSLSANDILLNGIVKRFLNRNANSSDLDPRSSKTEKWESTIPEQNQMSK